MILGDAASAQTGGQTTLDELFRYAADRRPNAIAIADPPDRASFTDGPPRRLSYAEADRIISAVAARLRQIGLKTDTLVGIQLPNTIENVLTILGVLRAGMIAVPLPLLWRSAETVAALNRLGAKVIITTSRIGGFDHCDLAMQVAAEVFPIRYVCSFGAGRADGVVAFDDLLSADASETTSTIERDGKPGDHVALVTWDVTPDGLVAVARNHTQLIAGGLACLLESGLAQDAAILGCCAMSSFAGLALTMMPWLLAGGTLSLHHAFDADAFAIQCRNDHCDTLVVPAPLVPQLAAAGLLAYPELKNVLAVWRAPERLPISPAWLHPSAALIDMLVFGEIALLGSRRGADGRPVPLPAGQVRAPHGSPNSVLMAEIERTEAGTIALRGPMVPRHAFPPGGECLAWPHLRVDPNGFVDTGYCCRLDPATQALQVTGPPPGIVSVGGYRFVSSELEALISRTGSGAALTALPDALAGHRLAGIAGNAEEVGAALAALGVNPLVAGAFRERRLPKAA